MRRWRRSLSGCGTFFGMTPRTFIAATADTLLGAAERLDWAEADTTAEQGRSMILGNLLRLSSLSLALTAVPFIVIDVIFGEMDRATAGEPLTPELR